MNWVGVVWIDGDVCLGWVLCGVLNCEMLDWCEIVNCVVVVVDVVIWVWFICCCSSGVIGLWNWGYLFSFLKINVIVELEMFW